MTNLQPITLLIGEAIPPEHLPLLSPLEGFVRLVVMPLRDRGAPGLLACSDCAESLELHALTAMALFDSTLPQNTLECFPNLRWIHLLGAGANRALDLGLFEKDIQITNSRGVAARPVAEWVLLCILSFARHLPSLVRQQDQRIWKRGEPDEIQGRAVGIIGLGAIGRAVARMAHDLGMRVIATDTRINPEYLAAGVDREYPLSQLADLMSESHFVVVCVPLTPKTRGMLGGRELAAMKRSGVLISVSRGGIVDETALAAMLREERIGGAALDVFEQEPLAPDSPWWSMPNVLISPHQAGWSNRYWERTLRLLIDNCQRYVTGDSLVNLLGKEGY